MKRLLQELQAALVNRKSAVLVTILSCCGSTPRGVGTAMVVCADGTQTGTIGGGSMEARARRRAMELSPDAASSIAQFELHSDKSLRKAPTIGSVVLLFRRFSGEAANVLLNEALQAIEQDDDAWLICPIVQQAAGETLLISSRELIQRFRLQQVPNGAVLLEGQETFFAEPLLNDPRILLFGGGHVAQKTAIQLSFLDYRVWIVEERTEFANAALFPTAERILPMPFEAAKDSLSIGKRDHAIVMTSAHETDYLLLRWLLTTPADYIGCIGSSQKIAYTNEKLLMDGMSLAQLSRIHAPIGLDIGAETPAEIAVSIAAELIAYRNEKEAEEV